VGTEAVVYIPYVEAVLVHIELMRFLGETHYGVFSRELVASALTRPQQAAAYDNADLVDVPFGLGSRRLSAVSCGKAALFLSCYTSPKRIPKNVASITTATARIRGALCR